MKQILLSIRMLLRFKVYTFVNFIGLAISLACVFTITRYIHQENTVDHCYPEYKRICFIERSISDGTKELSGYQSDLEKDPAVERYASFTPCTDLVMDFGKQEITVNALSIDSTFFSIFPYSIYMGSGKIKRPNDALITKEFWLHSLNGVPNPIGVTFKNSVGRKFRIVGVLDTQETKTSWLPDMFLPDELEELWFSNPNYAVVMTPGTDIAKLNEKYNKEQPRDEWSTFQTMHYQYLPLTDYYYTTSHEKSALFQHGNKDYIRVLWIVSFLVGIIGILNFTNIYTVIMSKRAREFGIKKVYGAGRKEIFLQIYIENMLLSGAALFICWLIIEITRHLFYNEMYIPTNSNLKFDLNISLLILFVLPLLTTFYPFIKFTHNTPVSSMRELSSTHFSVRSRMLFLGFQYVITIYMIVMSLFFVRQLEYMLHSDLGFRTHDVIECKMYVFKGGGTFHAKEKEDLLKEGKIQQANKELVNKRMSESTLFTHWSRIPMPLHQFKPSRYALNRAENGFKPVLRARMSPRSMELFEFQLLEGRLWNDSIDEMFTKNSFKCIINESAKKVFGIKDITRDKLQGEDKSWASSNVPSEYNPPVEIVGVIKDFNVKHLSQSAAPMIIEYFDEKYELITVTASYPHERRAEAIDFLRKLYEEATGSTDFEYKLIEDEIASMYNEDRRVVDIYSLFAKVAILISSLGLLAISLFDIRQRYREIGLRKVNGAQGKNIYPLLIKKYLSVLGIASLIAIPLSSGAIILYLEDFAHKAPITPDLFIIGIGATALISLLTIIWQIYKAANVNPAEVIKYE